MGSLACKMGGTQGPTYSPVEMVEEEMEMMEEKVEMLQQKKQVRSGHRIKLTLGLVCGLSLLAGMAFLTYRTNSGAAVTHNNSYSPRQRRDGGLITASVLAATIGAVVTSQTALGRPGQSAAPGLKGGCHWAGTAPFCDGACQANSGYEETARNNNKDDAVAYQWRTRHKQALEFGKTCWVGTKALCCRGANPDNTWEGEWFTTWGEVQRCRVAHNANYGASRGFCEGILICIDSRSVRTHFVIGHGRDCFKLSSLEGGLEGEALSGRIIWTGPSQSCGAHAGCQYSRWYKV